MNANRRGEIYLGDLARALRGLNCRSDEDSERVAAALGFGVQLPTPHHPVEIYDPRTVCPEPPARLAQRPTAPSAPPMPEPPPALPTGLLPAQLQPAAAVSAAAPTAPGWLQARHALFDPEREPQVMRESLFTERAHRPILSASLATLRSSGEVDFPKLLSAICRQRALAELPRRTEATLDLGCQLLLDYSASMVPFWEDLNSLIDQVTRVIGAENVRVFSFDARPGEAARWTATGERTRWRPEQRPVLVATDFGLMGARGRAQLDPAWRGFIDACGLDGSPLLMLIPWPRERWPLATGPHASLIHWSPHTSAAMVRRKLGLGHRVRR